MQVPENTYRGHKDELLEFLDSDSHGDAYRTRVRDIVQQNGRRLIVSLNDLRIWRSKFADDLLNDPVERFGAYEEAARGFIASVEPSYANVSKVRLGFDGSFGQYHVSPSNLKSTLLGKLVAVDGIVTKCSLVRPKVVRSVHYCPETEQTITREYRDATSLNGAPTSTVYPTRDENGHLLVTEFGMSEYKDHQTITIQEMPERTAPGQLPRSIDVVLDDDLVNACKPGDRVRIYGIFRGLPKSASGHTNGVFRTVIIANNTKQLSRDHGMQFMSDVDIQNIRTVAQEENIFDLLANSLAPSIYGHEFVKKALLLQLLGGVEKNLPNGTHLRGDINLLMVGDPSCGKSQLLRFVLNTAPLAISTTGRGSSGVGLTAAVTSDSETGERRLEAGAMVLADRGVVCIDEFDKMNDADRVAMHEVMEQQTVTIAKAGIHATLNARCSVLAAANPVYGTYNQYKEVHENVGLPDSLLSRFDLLFVMLDTVDAENDRAISDHVLRMHRYRRAGEEGLSAEPLGANDVIESSEDEDEDSGSTRIYEKFDRVLHGTGARAHAQRNNVLNVQFVKKFLFYAKNRCQPKLSDEATEYIGKVYADLRNKNQQSKSLPVTARTLETLIRLSTAHAKSRLSHEVSISDAEAAHDILQYALFKEAVPRTRKRSRKTADDDTEGESASSDSDGNDDSAGDDPDDGGRAVRGASSKRTKKAKAPKKRRGGAGSGEADKDDPFGFHEGEEDELRPSQQTPKSGDDTNDAALSKERVDEFALTMSRIFQAKRASELLMGDLLTEVNSRVDEAFSQSDMEEILRKLSDANKVMVVGDRVILV